MTINKLNHFLYFIYKYTNYNKHINYNKYTNYI